MLIPKQKGQGMVEYAIILFLVVIAVIAVMRLTAPQPENRRQAPPMYPRSLGEIAADNALEQYPLKFEEKGLMGAEVKTGKLVYEKVLAVTFAIGGDSRFCIFNFDLWLMNDQSALVNLNNFDKPKSGECEWEYVNERINEFIALCKKVPAIAPFMDEVGEAIKLSVRVKFGW